ncbi:hypothetical protein H3159_12015 [Flavobacterium sp. xlx-221]|nr:hypothetical protein [Flavobacterium sp. xlx-221]
MICLFKVTDLHGCEIEITNLNEAIKIAKMYKGYRHKKKNLSEFDGRQNAYWSDMYEKLKAIKNHNQ